MGFLSSVPVLEEWLDEATDGWSGLTNREYAELWSRWRAAFESRLRTGKPTAKDIDAMASIERALPFEAFLFSAPGYEFLPSGTSLPVFGYRVTPLARVDRDLFNSCDVIVADADLRFTCLYTHEIGTLADPIFIESVFIER
ncbi:MAG TPA: hypothetical protein VKK31_03700 [Thermoanaerobaculia bacterium]|nr:hypothetical protein [Thermoanaerobaculia bacterium]